MSWLAMEVVSLSGDLLSTAYIIFPILTYDL